MHNIFQTWKADVQLRLAYAPDLVQQGLDAIVDLSTFTDPELMTYWYSVAIETLRKQKRNLDISQVGPKATKAWTSVAKSFQRPNERREFWETLFAVAVQHDCWEDARNVHDENSSFAIRNLSTIGCAQLQQRKQC